MLDGRPGLQRRSRHGATGVYECLLAASGVVVVRRRFAVAVRHCISQFQALLLLGEVEASDDARFGLGIRLRFGASMRDAGERGLAYLSLASGEARMSKQSLPVLEAFTSAGLRPRWRTSRSSEPRVGQLRVEWVCCCGVFQMQEIVCERHAPVSVHVAACSGPLVLRAHRPRHASGSSSLCRALASAA